ncbi:hypothetical protein R4227_20890 [Gordonia amicalis]|uniref:Uncharacterized protein n=1 Tax=Gordonia amicalis TaxID=89053 RepID=A0ABU4DGH2_9ACTN|nr:MULTISPECIES: hypothetical protein [Gordonia]ATD70336.1 hypothetical protein CNO18_08685 [Gordonia sp. 1D]MDV6308833.1 hypothetical protein [Gordonia amicalis]MDV7102495.1 hypothetical protein [Gordonia amicalis]MDV7173428.1 hypothetical protein [Gordonia amicalis]UKO94059.1 hypothetical protein IHQ52_11795 [Gordonia amicalis]
MTAALAAGLGVAACSVSPEPQATSPAATQDAHLPPGFDTTFRWSATPVLDPQSAEGTFVRAYVESFELANAGASVEWGYPGFAEASPSNIDQMVTAYPSGVSDARRQVGSAFYTGIRRTDDADWTRIVLCRQGYHSVERDGSGPDRSWAIGYDTSRPVEIDIRRTGDRPPAAPRGGQRTPEVNVFGGWYTSRYDFSALYPTPTADQKVCAATRQAGMPHWLPTQGDDPWLASPAVPGWSAYPGVG